MFLALGCNNGFIILNNCKSGYCEVDRTYSARVSDGPLFICSDYDTVRRLERFGTLLNNIRNGPEVPLEHLGEAIQRIEFFPGSQVPIESPGGMSGESEVSEVSEQTLF